MDETRSPRRLSKRVAGNRSRRGAQWPLNPNITFHFLRHAFASIAAQRGVPVNVLSVIMGHSNVGVTQRVYLHLYGREQAEDAFRVAMGGG